MFFGFGQGQQSELATDPLECEVLQTTRIEIRRDGGSEVMKAVMPATAHNVYLFISRVVVKPLNAMTRGLKEIAAGEGEPAAALASPVPHFAQLTLR